MYIGGSGNHISMINRKVMTRLTKIMEDIGYRYFDWDFASGDAGGNKGWDPFTCYSIIRAGIERHPDYCVVLLHDTNFQSVRAVPLVLE